MMRPELATRLLDGRARVGGRPITDQYSAALDYLRALRDTGASPGQVVAIEGGEADRFFAAVLAVWLADCVPLPCGSLPRISLMRSVFVLRPNGDVRPPATTGVVDPVSTAVLHVTSGTTGIPKLARRSVASVLCEATGYLPTLGLNEDDRVYVPVSLAHSFGWGVAVGALIAGGQLDVSPAIHAGRSARRAEKATVVALTAPLARVLSDAPGGDAADARLRIAMVGASRVTAPLDEAFAARFGVRLSRNYGSSETGATFFGAAGLPEGVIGRPMPGASILEPGAGKEGELRLRLTAPFQGYLGEAPVPVSDWRTGDLVLRDETGIAKIIARTRQKSKLNDRTVDVRGVERVFREVPGVEEVFPIILPRLESGTEDLYVVVAGDAVNKEQVDGCRDRLPDGTRSARIIYRSSLPMNPNGKVDASQVVGLIHAERSRG